MSNCRLRRIPLLACPFQEKHRRIVGRATRTNLSAGKLRCMRCWVPSRIFDTCSTSWRRCFPKSSIMTIPCDRALIRVGNCYGISLGKPGCKKTRLRHTIIRKWWMYYWDGLFVDGCIGNRAGRGKSRVSRLVSFSRLENDNSRKKNLQTKHNTLEEWQLRTIICVLQKTLD